MLRIATVAAFAVLFAVFAPAAHAIPEVTETCSDTTDSFIVDWDCEFLDADYTAGGIITVVVNWSVEGGTAAFAGFDLRGNGYTPKAKNDPAEGTEPVVGAVVDNAAEGSVEVSFSFTELHTAGRLEGDIGNAHFHLSLFLIGEDGELPAKPSKFGVNVHVFDPAAEAFRFILAGDDAPVRPLTWGGIKKELGQ
jgi:hypothetical protein